MAGALADRPVSEIAASEIVKTIQSALIIVDRHLNITAADRAFQLTFRTSPGETVGSLIYELGNRQWDIPAYDVCRMGDSPEVADALLALILAGPRGPVRCGRSTRHATAVGWQLGADFLSTSRALFGHYLAVSGTFGHSPAVRNPIKSMT